MCKMTGCATHGVLVFSGHMHLLLCGLEMRSVHSFCFASSLLQMLGTELSSEETTIPVTHTNNVLTGILPQAKKQNTTVTTSQEPQIRRGFGK